MDSPVTQRTSFVIDPQAEGSLSALWITPTGTPVITGGVYRFNAAKGIYKVNVKFARVEFMVNIPEVPTAADARSFGLECPGMGNRGKIFFDITDDVFTVNTYDSAGVNIQTTTFKFVAAWEDVATRFAIDWFNDRVKFSYYTTDGDQVIMAEHKTSIGNLPLSPFINNSNSDNLDVSYILLDNCVQATKLADEVVLELTTGNINIAQVGGAATPKASDATDGNTKVLPVKMVDAAGETPEVSTADDTTTTNTKVLMTQNLDKEGKVVGRTPTVLIGGEMTVPTAGTAVPLASTPTPIQSVAVTAKESNTNNVYIGDSTVDKTSNKQFTLDPGDTVVISIADLATVYIDVDTNGEGVDFVASN